MLIYCYTIEKKRREMLIAKYIAEFKIIVDYMLSRNKLKPSPPIFIGS